jgi:uncharacterized protein (TIGR00369 family)
MEAQAMDTPSLRERIGARCFCCGPQNPRGLHLEFAADGPASVHTSFTAPEHWVGWEGVLHGGFQSLLLDETLSWAVFTAIGEDSPFVTAEITLRFRLPVPVGRSLLVRGRMTEDRGKTLIAEGAIVDEDGRVLTEARGTFARISEERVRHLARGAPPPDGQ